MMENDNGDEKNKPAPSEREKSTLLGALQSAAKEKDTGQLPPTPPRSTPPLPRKRSPLQNPPSPSMLPPRSGHERKVSWDIQSPDLLDGEAPSVASNNDEMMMSQITNPDYSRVSLKKLVKSSPFEDEAETYIQHALDDTDPTVAGKNEAQKSLLGNVPDDVLHIFDDEQEHEAAKMPSFMGRRKSTGDALWDMVAQMRKMQGHSESSLSVSSHIMEEQVSPGDVLAHNAATLLKRAKSKKTQEPSQEEIPTASTVRSDPKAKWKKLRQAVKGAGALKKNDDEPPSDDVDVETGEGSGSDKVGGKPSQGKSKHRRRGKTTDEFKSGFQDFQEWYNFSRPGIYQYMKNILFLIIPCTGVAALLFYAVGNPPCGTQKECIESQTIKDLVPPNRSSKASVSWWLLFLGVRQVLTNAAARALQFYLVYYLALGTRRFVKLFGPFVTLLIVQSKGWPLTLLFWGAFDFMVLYGDTKFARHWLFYQDVIDLFNENNPAGEVTSDKTYVKILGTAIGVGAVVSLKRFWVGLFLGRQTFSRYAQDLKGVMEKALLISEIATLARDMERHSFEMDGFDLEQTATYNKTLNKYNSEEGGARGSVLSASQQTVKSAEGGLVDDAEEGNFVGSDLTGSTRVKINELLGEWEEPEIVDKKNEAVPISSIIQFRQSLSCLNTPFPFSVAFGPADTRENCIRSAETVYGRLLSSHQQNQILKFDALALIAIRSDGSLDEEKLKRLVKLFRPDRDGNLTVLDFAKSVDSVYKELRLLRASVVNSSRMDKAFEKIFNIVFYFIVICIVLAIIGVNPFKIFAAISGFILGFTFMIGPASSKYFEGLLFILVRRPYDIGDRINVSDVNTDTVGTGSSGWIVKDVTLYYTTVVYGASSELATYSNGSLANSRVINHARSPQACLWFMMKFPIDTPYDKIKVFKGAMEKFIKARPREWISFAGFRASRVEVDAGFVEYIIIAVHRESWQSLGALKQSKADLTSFALELAKKMGMRYRAPPLPVDLTMKHGLNNASDLPSSGPDDQQCDMDASQGSHSVDIGSIAAMFETK